MYYALNLFAKKFKKDLVFQKSCHIFAPAFALKTAGSQSEGSAKYFEKKIPKNLVVSK